MGISEKEPYSSPRSEVLEAMTEAILALSPQFGNPFNPEQNW